MEKLIVLYDSQNKIVEMSLFDFVKIQYNNGSPFEVCNVTNDEFTTMEKQVKHDLLYELKPRLGSSDAYNPFRFMMSYNGIGSDIVITDYNDENKKGAYLLSGNSLTYDENIDKDQRTGGIKIYTTCDYEMVLNYYLIKSKNLDVIRTEEIKKCISDLDKKIWEFQKERYKLYAKLYENEYEKKGNSI